MPDSPTPQNTQSASQLREAFVRNVKNCQRVIANDFEEVLADIIDQFEHPPLIGGVGMTTLGVSELVAEAMIEGFSGLHPAGFDFACWFWEVAPLHVVDIPAPAYGTSGIGFRHAVLLLRRTASMLCGMYVARQPQKNETVIELIDSSIDWVDARNLVKFALVDHFERVFVEEETVLIAMAEGEKIWRRLIPLGLAARLIGMHPEESDRAINLVRKALPFLDEESTYRAILYTLRVAALYGDQRAILSFFDTLRISPVDNARRLFCELLINPKQHWERIPKKSALALFRSWLREATPDIAPCLSNAILRLQGEEK